MKRPRASSSSDATTREHAYATWLRARGVWWKEDALETSQHGVVAGWGVVATQPIDAGELLFKVPQRACFGARSERAKDAPPPEDTQEHLATLILREKKKGSSSVWAPMLEMLTHAPTPWVWPDGAAQFLAGTELEAVLAMKRRRLAAERSASAELTAGWSEGEYAEACALATSQ